jgi:hypothetical protein
MSGINGVAIHASSTENTNCRVAALLLAVLGLDLRVSVLEHERTGQETYGTPFLSENEGHVSLELPYGQVR